MIFSLKKNFNIFPLFSTQLLSRLHWPPLRVDHGEWDGRWAETNSNSTDWQWNRWKLVVQSTRSTAFRVEPSLRFDSVHTSRPDQFDAARFGGFPLSRIHSQCDEQVSFSSSFLCRWLIFFLFSNFVFPHSRIDTQSLSNLNELAALGSSSGSVRPAASSMDVMNPIFNLRTLNVNTRNRLDSDGDGAEEQLVRIQANENNEYVVDYKVWIATVLCWSLNFLSLSEQNTNFANPVYDYKSMTTSTANKQAATKSNDCDDVPEESVNLLGNWTNESTRNLLPITIIILIFSSTCTP